MDKDEYVNGLREFVESLKKFKQTMDNECDCKNSKENEEKCVHKLEFEIDKEQYEKRIDELPYWVINFETAKKFISCQQSDIMSCQAIIYTIQRKYHFSQAFIEVLQDIENKHEKLFTQIMKERTEKENW